MKLIKQIISDIKMVHQEFLSYPRIFIIIHPLIMFISLFILIYFYLIFDRKNKTGIFSK